MVESLERHGHLNLDPDVRKSPILCERRDHRQAAQTYQGTGGQSKEAQAEEAAWQPRPGSHLQ